MLVLLKAPRDTACCRAFLLQGPAVGQSGEASFRLPELPLSISLLFFSKLCSGNLAGRVCGYFQRNEWVSQQRFPRNVCAQGLGVDGASALGIQDSSLPQPAPPLPLRQESQDPASAWFSLPFSGVCLRVGHPLWSIARVLLSL